jgi:hypothetical protein
MMEATVTNERSLIIGAMAGGVGLPQGLQDDAHRLQDIASHAWILGDSWDGRQAKIHQNLAKIASRLATVTCSTSVS